MSAENRAPSSASSFGRHVLDVALAAVQPIDPVGVDVVAGHVVTDPRELHRERQSDVSETDDSDSHRMQSRWADRSDRPPPRPLKVNFSSMRHLIGRALIPAVVGVACARHLAWYVSYQMSGEARS